jgi:hypothetical protein
VQTLVETLNGRRGAEKWERNFALSSRGAFFAPAQEGIKAVAARYCSPPDNANAGRSSVGFRQFGQSALHYFATFRKTL